MYVRSRCLFHSRACPQTEYWVSFRTIFAFTLFIGSIQSWKSLLISSLFDDNLREVDSGVSKVYALFNGLFPDGKTAYIFTADHGMSNKGIHLNCKFHLKTKKFKNLILSGWIRCTWSWHSTWDRNTDHCMGRWTKQLAKYAIGS